MANRDRSRSLNRRTIRDRNRISALIDANEVPSTRNQSQVVRIGSLTLTDGRGNVNQRGQLFESIVNERDNLPQTRSQYNTDPFIRGTRTDGRFLVADRLSGNSIRVAQLLQNGTIKVLKAGNAYYQDNRSEYVIHLPVWINYSRRSVQGVTQYDSYRNNPETGEQYSIPINELAMQERLRGKFANQPNLTHIRSRTATAAEQKAFLKEAVIRWLTSQSTTRDANGRIPLQQYDANDHYFSFDPNDINDVNFTFDELRTNFHDRSGAPTVETILGRTLHGNVTIPDNFWNKAGLCPEALIEQANGGCVRAQLPTVLLRRHREYESRDGQGIQNKTPLVDCMQQAFTNEEFKQLYDKAFKAAFPGRPMGPMREEVAKEFGPQDSKSDILAKFVPVFVKYVKTQKTIEEIMAWCSHKTIKGFTPALRDSFKEMSVKGRYVAFFKTFPKDFIVVDNRVTSRDPDKVMTATIVEPESAEEEIPIRAYPYQHDDYHYIGHHHSIIVEFGKLTGYPIHAMHQNIQMDKYVPDGWTKDTKRPAVVYKIHDDHAYFYDAWSTNGLHTKQMGKPHFAPKDKLLHRLEDEDEVTNLNDMHPYTEAELIKALDEKKSQICFTCFSDFADIAKRLNEELKVSFRTSYEVKASKPIPECIRSLTIYCNKSRIIIRKISLIADVLRDFCHRFQAETGFKLEYKGQQLPTVAYKAIYALLVTKRKQLPEDIRHELAVAQDFKCPLCTEQLPEDLSKCEVDHIRRLDQGGKEDKDNMQLIHRPCYRLKTQKENLSVKSPTPRIESQFNYYVKQLFDETSFPTQVVWGEKPETSAPNKDVQCIDICNCRPNSLFSYGYDLPVFSPIDDPQPCIDSSGALLYPLDHFDYYLVDAMA